MIELPETRRGLFMVLMAIGALLPLLAGDTSLGAGTDRLAQEDAYEMRESGPPSSQLLFADPRATEEKRAEFMAKLRTSGKNKRPLFEDYIPIIGASAILDVLETVWPHCHSQAHDLGKVIFSQLRNIGDSLRICANRCYSGCMHGVLMEAFGRVERLDRQHLNLAALKPVMEDLCAKNQVMTISYSPGDCAHAVGHALMFLAIYDVPQAIQACTEFGTPAMEYYCTTGAYMEYVRERDPEDAVAKSVLYPCDMYDYPAACARYKMFHVVRRYYNAGKTTDTLKQLCETLEGHYRLGCYHGLGNGHMELIAADKISIRRVCLGLGKDEEFVCIEGAMERMAKYQEPRALEVCQELEGENKSTCVNAVAHKMYDMQKDLSLYLAK